MRKKNFKRKNEMSLPLKNIIDLMISSVIGVIFTVFLTFVISFIISKSENLPNYTAVLFLLCVAIGNTLGGFIASKKCNFKGIISGILCSIPNSIIITIIMLFFTDGKISEKTIILFFIVLIFSTIGGIVGANTKRRK